MEKFKRLISLLIIRVLHGVGFLLALNILFDLGLQYNFRSIAAATMLAIFFA